jgi:cytochrome c-type biogenesis protein CcmF
MGFLRLFKKGVQDSNRFGAAPQSTRIAGVRWHGARVVHVGVAIMFIGIAGSGGYGKETQVAMRPGDKTTFGGYELAYVDLEANHGRNFTAMTAKMSIYREGELLAELKPAKAFYPSSNKWVSEIDVRRRLGGDLYLALTDADINQKLINLRIMVKPLINWIWIGSTVMCVGAAMVLLALCMPKKAAANTGKDES